MGKSHRITGGGGIQLHAVETGNPKGRPILFLHGLSQCWLSWSRQMSSDLADDYRLVSMDLRGHGLSDRPREGYTDSKLWAEDVNAAIHALSLDHPILCGFSYGPLVILDYLRHYGDDGIGGLNFVGGVTRLGTDEAVAVLTPAFLSLVPGFFATDVEGASAVSSRSCACASFRSLQLKSCIGCSAGASRFSPASARQCSPARSTTTTSCRGFAGRC